MKIAVAIRGVLDSERLPGTQGGRFDLTSAAYRPNEDDDQALEAALTLRESADASVVAVSIAPRRLAEPARRRAVALGIDDTLGVWDDALEGADTAATALVLAALLKKRDVDLALFGERSDDTGGGALPPYVAEILGWPFVGRALAVSADGSRGSARRRLAGGFREVVAFALPAVVSIASGAQQVRYAKVADQLRAERAQLETRRPRELDLHVDEAAVRPRVHVERLTLPKPTCAVPTTALHPLPEMRVMLALADAGARGASALAGEEATSAAIRRLTESGIITGREA